MIKTQGKPKQPKAEKEYKLELSDILNSINKKGDMIPDADIEAGYVPFVVTRCLSNTRDTVLFANEVNYLNISDKVMQYHFYYHGIDKNPRRFGKWHKAEKEAEAIRIIKERYGYSYQRAREVMPLLINKIDEIKQELDKGGVNGKPKRN